MNEETPEILTRVTPHQDTTRANRGSQTGHGIKVDRFSPDAE